MGLKNVINIEQKQVISTQQQQSLNILSMTNVELFDFLEKQSEENPVLEVESKWIEQKKLDSFNQVVDKAITLEEYLIGQIDVERFTHHEIHLLHILIKMIDSQGFLKENESELLKILAVDDVTLYRLLYYIHHLDPIGVGSSNFRECLKFQLDAKGLLDEVLERMIDFYLEALTKGNFGKVAKELGISTVQVKYYYQLIKVLNPKPGNGFGIKDEQYITPDLVLNLTNDGYELILERQSLPQVTISTYWEHMMKEAQNDDGAKAYLESKWQAARKLVQAVEERKKTILAVGHFIVERQYLYFKTGNSKYIKPLKLKDIAEAIGVHESTVSRAVNTKYLLCSQGIYSLKYFLSTAIGKKDTQLAGNGMENVSKESIKEHLRELIENENKAKPLSDSKLQVKLQEMGFEISRRTVVKYREELNIGSSFQRGTLHV